MTKVLEIYKGENKSFTLKVRDGNDDPVNLTGATAFDVVLPGASAPVALALAAGVALVSGDLGKVEVDLDETETAALKEGLNQDIQVSYELSSVIVKRTLKRSLHVYATE